MRIVAAGKHDEKFKQSLIRRFGFSGRAVADLAIGFFTAGLDRRRCAFERRTHGAGVAALIVTVDADRILVGPLAIAGKAGCAHCAHERLRGAAAGRSAPAAATRRARVLAQRIVLREVDAIVERGVDQSHLRDAVLAIDVRNRSESLHRVIPLSRCSVCGGAAASSADPIQSLDGWLDPVTGVISDLHIEDAADSAALIVATTAPPWIVKDDETLRPLPVGWGKGLTLNDAVLSAVGEAIERYSASLPDPARLVCRRGRDLEGEILDPRAFPLYSAAQYRRMAFPYNRFNRSIKHPWVLGRWLAGGGEVWIPAVLAFLSARIRPEQLIAQGTSNGLAASTDADDAALRAVFELVERDAFMSAWMTSTPAQPIILDHTLDPALAGVLRGVEQLGASIEIYILPTSACGTTVLCLARGDGQNYPGATVALAADLDPRRALRQAVLELGQTAPYLRQLMRSQSIAVPATPRDVRQMMDHAAYYFPVERAAAFDFLRRGRTPMPLAKVRARKSRRTLAACATLLAAANVRVALVDVTSPDVATGPFRVFRALSPDLQPISYGYGLERQPVARVRQMGLAADAPPVHPIW